MMKIFSFILPGTTLLILLLNPASVFGEEPLTLTEEHPRPEVIEKGHCLECHSVEGFVERSEGVPPKSIYINPELFAKSVHGNLDCTSCHIEFGKGFHSDPDLDDETRILFQRVFSEKSRSSHQALSSCRICHEQEFNDYRDSVHGKALMEESIPDTPYCTDCHGKHYIKSKEDPTSATHLTNVPLVCAYCHTDEALVLRYNLDRSVYRGYYDTYHGKKQELGNAKVPVCTTCHTAHAIKSPADPQSSVYGEAGAKTCGECHEGADESFVGAFTHKPLTFESAPIVYIVRWIYSWILTVVILGMVFYIALDLFAQIRMRMRRGERAK